MESKGRRAPRAAGPTAAPAEPGEPVTIHAAAPGPLDIASEPPEPPEIIAEAAETMETALDIVTNAAVTAAPPSIDSPAAERSAETPAAHSIRDSFPALAQSQAALTHGLEAISVEMAGMALSGIDSAARSASDMLSVRTLSDAIVLNARLACTGLEALVGGSARLSELGVRLTSETAQSILAQLGKSWLLPSRIGSSAIRPWPETPGSAGR